jgi:hypothetical protein
MQHDGGATGWPVRGGAVRLLVILALGFCIFHGIAQLLTFLRRHTLSQMDFFGLWSFARFARTHAPALLYQPAILNAYQHTLAPGLDGFYPFPYPPDFLLFLWPFGALSYAAAEIFWLGLSATLFSLAIWFLLQNDIRWRGFGVVFALLAPASLVNATIGETGFFTSALLIGGFNLLPRRPVLAGILFGLLTLKPQLGVLVPVALLALGAWQTIAAAGVTALLLVALSCAVFAPGLWLTWWHALASYQAMELQNLHELFGQMTTIAAAVQSVGIPPAAATVIQILVSIVIAIACFMLFRRGPYRLAVAALLAGTYIASPHAYIYDSTAVAAALLIFAEFAAARSGAFTFPEIIVGILAFLLPVDAGPEHSHIVFTSVAYLLLFLILVRLYPRLRKQ